MRTKLKQLLQQRGLSLTQFSRDLDMDYSSLHNLYAGKSSRIDFRTLRLITQHLGLTRFDELFEGGPPASGASERRSRFI